MVAFCVGIYFLVLCIRYIAELKFPILIAKPSWNKSLRVMPPVLGGVAAAVMYKYPFLDTLPTWGSRFIYGCFGGGVASFAYLVFKAAVQKWFGVKVDTDDDGGISKKKKRKSLSGEIPPSPPGT